MNTFGVFYSDFDGVYNIPEKEGLLSAVVNTPQSKFFKPETEIFWNNSILKLVEDFIDSNSFEYQWLTTWNELSLIHGAADVMDFKHKLHAPAKLNHTARNKSEWTEWKAQHIIQDQLINPRPFVWVDDNAPIFWTDFVKESTTAPSLILTTDSNSGLSQEDIRKIIEWRQILEPR